MAQLPDLFKASETDDASFKALPLGWYPAQVIKSNIKDNSAGTGKYIALQFKILEGEFAKRILFCNYNIIHPNETAVNIAKSQLKQLVEAMDMDEIEDTEELHGNPVQIYVTLRAATAQYPESNDIKGYRNIDATDNDSDPFG